MPCQQGCAACAHGAARTWFPLIVFTATFHGAGAAGAHDEGAAELLLSWTPRATMLAAWYTAKAACIKDICVREATRTLVPSGSSGARRVVLPSESEDAIWREE